MHFEKGEQRAMADNGRRMHQRSIPLPLFPFSSGKLRKSASRDSVRDLLPPLNFTRVPSFFVFFTPFRLLLLFFYIAALVFLLIIPSRINVVRAKRGWFISLAGGIKWNRTYVHKGVLCGVVYTPSKFVDRRLGALIDVVGTASSAKLST